MRAHEQYISNSWTYSKSNALPYSSFSVKVHPLAAPCIKDCKSTRLYITTNPERGKCSLVGLELLLIILLVLLLLLGATNATYTMPEPSVVAEKK